MVKHNAKKISRSLTDSEALIEAVEQSHKSNDYHLKYNLLRSLIPFKKHADLIVPKAIRWLDERHMAEVAQWARMSRCPAPRR